MSSGQGTSRLIILDGITGTGKTTAGEIIAGELAKRNIACRFFPEIEEGHPLRIYGPTITFDSDEIRDWYAETTTSLWSRFVETRPAARGVTIIESWLFQDTIGWSLGGEGRSGLGHKRALALMDTLASLIKPLRPVLIYFQVSDVESHLRKLYLDRRQLLADGETYASHAIAWRAEQDFVQGIVDAWNIPKLLMLDRYFIWDRDGPFILDAIGVTTGHGRPTRSDA